MHRFSPRRFLVLGASVAAVFAVALGPFLVGDVAGHGRQLLSRLFPFQRGLCHAYWAPNLWALYSALDRVSLLALSRAGIALPGASTSASATTSGLVADAAPAVLPAVRPQATMVLTLVAMAVRTPRAAARGDLPGDTGVLTPACPVPASLSSSTCGDGPTAAPSSPLSPTARPAPSCWDGTCTRRPF